MVEASLLERLAARGAGVTGDGRQVAGAAPGDRVRDDGILIHGPNRTEPVCRHFGKCGGCQLQHVAEPALADFVRDRVVGGLAGQEVPYGEVFPARLRSEEHTSELQSLMRISYAVFCLKKKIRSNEVNRMKLSNRQHVSY